MEAAPPTLLPADAGAPHLQVLRGRRLLSLPNSSRPELCPPPSARPQRTTVPSLMPFPPCPNHVDPTRPLACLNDTRLRDHAWATWTPFNDRPGPKPFLYARGRTNPRGWATLSTWSRVGTRLPPCAWRLPLAPCLGTRRLPHPPGQSAVGPGPHRTPSSRALAPLVVPLLWRPPRSWTPSRPGPLNMTMTVTTL